MNGTTDRSGIGTVGFVGLGNVGGKLAGSLARNGFPLTVLDLDRSAGEDLVRAGAQRAQSGRELAERSDVIITCLPSPDACANAMEAKDGILEGIDAGKYWLEMSTTHHAEVVRLGEAVRARGGAALDTPVSGGCHRAATGNISIFAGGERADFEQILPVLSAMGRRILHTGALGSASVIKVVTNYLASANLVALGEALMVARQAGMDLATTHEAIGMSSGNSFVSETETQVILNGSYNINFTMDLVGKDMGLFLDLARTAGVPVEVAPLVEETFRDGQARYGDRAWSSMIVRRLEDACGADLRAGGFPAELTDDEPEVPGSEVIPRQANTRSS